MTILLVARVLTGAAFLVYGVLCLTSPTMTAEFERYGLPRLRVLIALLEIAGALGLVLGPTPRLIAAAAIGLSLLMIGALAVRARIQDPWQAMVPAFGLLLVNAWIATQAWHSGRG